MKITKTKSYKAAFTGTEDVCGKGCINETFRVLKERELRELGEYRTKRLVMEAWNKFEFDNKLKMLCYEK